MGGVGKGGQGGTRSRRQIYLLSHPLHMFAPNRLPTNGEVIRRVYHVVRDNPNLGKEDKIGCHLLKGTADLKCSKSGVCEEGPKQSFTGVCISRELINLWDKAGFDKNYIVSEKTIK